MDIGSYADWFSGSMSALAVTVAVGGYWWSERVRRRQQNAADRHTGQLIGIKLFKVMNGTHDIYRHLFAEYSGPPLGGQGSHELWRRIHPMIGLTEDPTLPLDSAEINLLIGAKKHDFLMEAMLVTARYQSIVSSMKEYAVRYEAIHALTPAPYEIDGKLSKHALSAEQFMKIQPYSMMLETLIQALREMTKENVTKCNKLGQRFGPMMCEFFNDPNFMKLGALPESAAPIS